MNNLADAELAAAFAAGGPGAEAAFAEIVRRHGGLVYAACRRQLGPAAAEDAVQAVFMLLARKARTLSRREALAGWLHGAARLVAREHRRAERRRRRAEKEAAAMRAAERSGRAADWDSLRPELDAALAALPRRYRDAVILAKLEGHPEAGVARELGVPTGTVKSRLARGLEMLRERLGQRGAVCSVAALGAALAAHGVEAVPAALAAKLAAIGSAGAAIGGAGASAAGLAMVKGAVKAMFWAKVKMAATAVIAAATVSTAVPLTVAAVRGAETPATPAAASSEKGIECRVTELIPGGKVKLSAGSAQGVKEKFEFEVSREGQPVGTVKVVAVEEKQCTAEIASVTGEIKVGDTARTRFSEVPAQPGTGENPPAPADAGKVAWGEAAGGLQAGLIPLGGGAAKDWPRPFVCKECYGFVNVKSHQAVPGKCAKCGAAMDDVSLVKFCGSCAARERICARCGAAKPWGATFTEGEPVRLEIHLKNVGESPLKVAGKSGNVEWTPRLVSKSDGSTWLARFHAPGAGGPGMPTERSLPKGGEFALELVLAQGWRFDKEPVPELNPLKAVPSTPLPPGKYAVTATSKTAKVTTGAAEIEVKPRGAAAPAAGGEWRNLFADEAWYKGQAGDEQVFTGTLEAVKPPEVSALMRDSLYRLGDRNIYTGAKKIPALDALVGRKVEIRGKAVDMNLEGQNLKEIWPAAVRAAQ